MRSLFDCSNLDFSEVDYKCSQEKIKITCSIHGLFEAIPSVILSAKKGCPSWECLAP